MRGDRWGIEGPPEEAYSRVTNPERFQPLHAAATELLDRLEREFGVERLEGHDADDELGKVRLARPLASAASATCYVGASARSKRLGTGECPFDSPSSYRSPGRGLRMLQMKLARPQLTGANLRQRR